MNKISFYSIACITVFFIVMFIFQEQRVESDLERRDLVNFPSLSVTAFASGEFQDDFEEALKDQVFERDSIVRLNNTIKARNRQYYNVVHGRINELKTLAFPPPERVETIITPDPDDLDDNDEIASLDPEVENDDQANSDHEQPENDADANNDANDEGTEGEVDHEGPSDADDANDFENEQDSDVEPEPSPGSDREPDPSPEPAPGSEQEPDSSPDSEATPDPAPDSGGNSDSAPDPDRTPEPDPTPEPSPEPDPDPDPTPESEPEPEPEPDPEPTPEPDPTPVVNEYELQPSGSIYKIAGTNHLTEYPTMNDTESREAIDVKAFQYAEMLERHPHLKMYVYYVTKGQDLDWFDKSEGIQSFDYIGYFADQLDAKIKFDYLKFNSLEEYKRLAYATDHHWSHEGSYQGYKDMLAMMAQDFDLPPVKEPVRELDFGGLDFMGALSGSGGSEIEPDPFKAYEFDLGEYRSFINEREGDFHQYEEYANGEYGRIDRHFMNYHGNQEGSNLIRHEFADNEYNLLMIADSNNRPIRRLLASHFHTTYFVEYRMLDKVDLDDIIEEYEIDAVLIYGQDRYWVDPRYTFNNYPRP